MNDNFSGRMDLLTQVARRWKCGRVFLRRPIWLAWYPLRGRQCRFGFDATRDDAWHFSAALGSLYLGFGPGVPLP